MRCMRPGSARTAHRRRACVVAPPLGLPPIRFRHVLARGGVYVPSDSFGGQSPEKKAAGILRTFFTFVAARVVLAQLEGSGRGALGAYDSQAATDLHHFLQAVPMRDGDEWLEQLTRKNTSLGLRLMEVRDSYCEEAFEWDQLQRLAKKDMKAANTQLMRRFANASLEASLGEGAAAGGGSGLPAAARANWRSAVSGGGGGDSTVVAAAAYAESAAEADNAADSAIGGDSAVAAGPVGDEAPGGGGTAVDGDDDGAALATSDIGGAAIASAAPPPLPSPAPPPPQVDSSSGAADGQQPGSSTLL